MSVVLGLVVCWVWCEWVGFCFFFGGCVFFGLVGLCGFVCLFVFNGADYVDYYLPGRPTVFLGASNMNIVSLS